MRPTDPRRADPAEESDAALLERIARRERAAITTLFRRYHRRLFRYLTRMLWSEAMAEELVNEVFLEVWRSAGRFEGRSATSSWLFGIAHHKAVSELRKRREASLEDERSAALQESADNPAADAEHAGTGRILQACLERLSAEHREVLELAYYHELSVGEIAEIAGCPENTVKTRMFHARKRLRALLPAAGLDGDGA